PASPRRGRRRIGRVAVLPRASRAVARALPGRGPRRRRDVGTLVESVASGIARAIPHGTAAAAIARGASSAVARRSVARAGGVVATIARRLVARAGVRRLALLHRGMEDRA